MLFENLEQYKKAKEVLIESEGNIDIALAELKDSKEFRNVSEGQLILSLTELNEGLGDKILNFLGSKLGGDIADIKTVLTQMKDQELKFNREEFEIYNQFYSLLQDQKALDKDKENPSYHDLSREIFQSRNSLNTRMKELTKVHNEIFNALEEKIKGLTKDSNRKKRYFNAQRATDVLETKNDRYEKVKAITAKNAERSNDLEDFFGVSVASVEKDANKAKEKAANAVNTLTNTKTTTPGPRGSFLEDPEKSIDDKLEKIRNAPGGFYAKRKDIEKIQSDINDIFASDDYKKFSDEKKKNINNVNTQADTLYKELEREEKKVK
jgi:hypothetical protein